MSKLNFTETPDSIYIEALRTNDEKVLKELYVANYHRVEDYVIKNSGSTEHAKDIYQEAFTALWRNVQLDKFMPANAGSLNNYLFTIAKNKWLDYLRTVKVKKNIKLDDEYAELMSIEETDDITIKRLTLVKEKFKALGDNCRNLLKRFYYGRESLKSIAAVFNWTEATAKNNKYRCIEKLRSLLKD
ncbi:MAG TPA: sigma-70 family RNA polymerase sigma factor [Niabella sp.]|nr:sigma-70 family RNA polymerase sigma factor [Niabella sp.]